MTMTISKKQQGFTLIELMISLVLGLLIVAAVMQVYVTIVATKTIQQSGSEITDVSVFGVQQLERSIRMANLGNSVTKIHYKTVDGGIVLQPRKLVGGVLTDGNLANVEDNLLTNSVGAAVAENTGTGVPAIAAWSGVSNTNIKSDQLTIQYKNITGKDIIDCEGNTVENNKKLIERYFLRQPTTNPTGSAGLVLACDAGRIDETGNITDFGGDGEEIILNVDQFKIQLGLQGQKDNPAKPGEKITAMSYLPPHEYMALPKTADLYRASIVAVKVGMIVRGSTPIVGDVTPPTEFNVLGEKNTISATTPKYARRMYESTAMLRNARLVSIVATGAREL